MQTFQSLVAFCYSNGPGVDGQRLICMEAVVPGGNIERTAVDSDRGVGVDRIIGGVNGENSAVDGQLPGRLNTFETCAVVLGACIQFIFLRRTARRRTALAAPLPESARKGAPRVGALFRSVHASAAGSNGKAATVYLHGGGCAQAIALCSYGKGPALDVYIAQCSIIRIFGVQPVLAGSQGKGCVCDAYIVLALKRVGSGSDVIISAGDGQGLLGGDAMSCRGCDDQAPGAVQGQIVFGKDGCIDIIFIDGGKAAAV